MMTKEELTAAIDDISLAIYEGWHLHDTNSEPTWPRAPNEYYDKLARAITAYVRAVEDVETAVMALCVFLPQIEQGGMMRERLIEQDKLRQENPEFDQICRQLYEKKYGTPAPDSALEEAKASFQRLLAAWPTLNANNMP